MAKADALPQQEDHTLDITTQQPTQEAQPPKPIAKSYVKKEEAFAWTLFNFTTISLLLITLELKRP